MICVIGTGPMGTALAEALRVAGYGVRQVSARDALPALARAWLVVYALPLAAALAAAAALPDGRGRILVDVTNPAFESGPPRPELAARSSGELLSDRLPSWRVVKAFNTVPAVLVGSPRLGGATVTVPVAGNDPPARRAVRTIATRLGFHAVDAGDITASRAIEGLAALLWRIGDAHHLGDRVGFHLLTAASKPTADLGQSGVV